MLEKNKGRLIYNSEFIGPKEYIRILNNKSIFISNNLNINTYKIIYLGLNRNL